MDAYQQSQGYARPPLPPPLPSMADPQHLQQHHQLPPPPPPPPRQPFPQQGPWYSGQYQYQPPPSASSASPPPPPPPHQHQQPPSQQQQWAPPPYSDQYAPPPAYPPPHHNQVLPYPPQQHLHNQYPPPPRPHMLPPPPPPPPSHQSYPQVNQDWSNQNWAHHQGWEYPVHSNEEDWATRARAWAAAKAAMDYQHPPPQSTSFTTRAEEQTQYHDQHSQAFDPHFPQTQQQTHPTSSYPQFQSAPAHLLPVGHLQESEYVPDGNSSYTARDETLAGNSNAVLPHRESLPTSPNFHQQEVPSSYSSVTGKGEAGNQADLGYRSSQEGQHHAMSSGHAVGRSDFMGLPFSFRNQSTDYPTDPSNLPLDFAPRFNRAHEPHMHSSFPQPDTTGRMHSSTPVHAWAPPVAPGVIYPPIHPHDPSVAVSSPTPLLGRIHGPGFQPTVPSVSAPFALGAGSALHSTTAFPGDAYGVSGLSDRPKKAAVPNWLREEIIKKKAVIASSAQEHTNEDTLSIEDEGVEKSLGKGDQADSKSIDSSRSTEEDDDDEDYVEAAKTAAINQEIKRILTEVLLKVTDELFDEIATKVLSEDDPMVKVDRDTVASNHRASPSPPANPTAKASAKLLIPVRSKEFKTGDASEKSSSSSPGDVLGLGNYASDEDDDDENQTSSMRNSKETTIHQQLSREKHSEDIHDAGKNGSSQPEIEEHDKDRINLDNVSNKSSLATVVSGVAGDVINVGGERLDGINDSELKYKLGEKVVRKPELPGKDVNAKNLMPDSSQGRETVTNLDKNGRYENKRSSPGKDSVKEVESGKITADGNKAGENPVKQDERHVRKEKTDDRNGSKERKKEEGAKPEERTKESVSKKKSIRLEVEEDRKEKERGKRASAREDNGKKRERVKDEKDDRSKHKPQSDTSKHKRRRSPSSRGRNSKENSVVSHANDTSDEASEDSRRKLHSKRRNLSPSPVKSRRRQLSRSPHSKHSQRRHSPYSSLETTRKRRSRSRSPIRRQR